MPELRGRVRRRTSRLRAGAWTVAQTTLAVGAAWTIATAVNDRPFFAPIAAVISLGAARGQRRRQAVELSLGVAVGIAIADLIVVQLGSGTLVLMLVVALSMGAALLIGGGPLLVSQAGASAVLVATIERPTGLTPDRFVDALIGGGVALLIGQVLLPRDPVAAVTGAARAVGDRLCQAMREAAEALRSGDLARARHALEIARSADPHVQDFAEAVDLVRETVSLRPPMWRARERLPMHLAAIGQLDFAVRNTRVLCRRTVAAVRRAGPAPPGLADAVALLADAVEDLVDHLVDPGAQTQSRRLALEAATRATAVYDVQQGLQTSAIIAQVRSTAIDLLRGSGLSEEEATLALEDAVGPPAERD
jgi:Fusaric acid resistance protein-like